MHLRRVTWSDLENFIKQNKDEFKPAREQRRSLPLGSGKSKVSTKPGLRPVLRADFAAMTPAMRKRLLLNEICNYLDLENEVVFSKERSMSASKQRRIFCYEMRRRGWSLIEIGRVLGRDHTTVLHHINRVTKEEKDDIFERARRQASVQGFPGADADRGQTAQGDGGAEEGEAHKGREGSADEGSVEEDAGEASV